MITYVYETIPKSGNEKIERFEWQQSIHDDALVSHPETGVPVRRILTEGLGYTSSSGKASKGDCCQNSCGC